MEFSYLKRSGNGCQSVTAFSVASACIEFLCTGVRRSRFWCTPDSVPANTLLVVVERYVVTPPDCPNWTKSSSDDHDNSQTSNFGCSTVTNLGLMVANPRDLVIARQLGPASAAQAGLAIQRYRSGQTAPLPSDTAGSTYKVTVNQSGASGSSGGATAGQ